MRRRYLNFVNVFSLFPYHLSLEKGVALHFYKIESLLTKNPLCQVWLKLAEWFLRIKCESLQQRRRQQQRRTTDKFRSKKLTKNTKIKPIKNPYLALRSNGHQNLECDVVNSVNRKLYFLWEHPIYLPGKLHLWIKKGVIVIRNVRLMNEHAYTKIQLIFNVIIKKQRFKYLCRYLKAIKHEF